MCRIRPLCQGHRLCLAALANADKKGPRELSLKLYRRLGLYRQNQPSLERRWNHLPQAPRLLTGNMIRMMQQEDSSGKRIGWEREDCSPVWRSLWIAVALSSCAGVEVAQSSETKGRPRSWPVVYQELASIRTAAINDDLKMGVPTVDVAIYLAETEGQPHVYATSPEDLRRSFERAKEIFTAAGVQLRLLWVRRATVPSDWLSVQANEVRGVPSPPELNKYVGYRAAKWGLTMKSQQVFERVIQRSAENHRTIYLLYLQAVRMAYPDPKVTDRLEGKVLSTSGLSLPAYLFEARIPRRVRGVITLTRKGGEHGRLIAHELGHKLINVSHEYRDIDPQFEVRGNGGLMLYGSGTEIPSGKVGRWHRERLHLSPFIYRTGNNGTLEWNADYVEAGHYYDPLYGDEVIRFGQMERSKESVRDLPPIERTKR